MGHDLHTAARPARPPWTGPLWVGLALRLVAALSGFGWFAPDDYTFVIAQSAQWLQDPRAPFPCDYRSTLLPRLFWLLSALAAELGLHDPTNLLRFAYAALGVASIAAIPAVYKLTARHGDELTARTAAWLTALFFLMPRISTRPLLETAALVPLVWGALWLDRAREGAPHKRFKAAFAGALLLGVACMLRFQVGILVPAVLVLLATSRRPGQGRAWAGLLTGGTVTALLQIAVDASAGRAPFATPLAYLRYNLALSHSFGVSPWYTYLGHFLTFTLPPVTLAIAVPLVRSLRRHVTVSTLFAVFVVGHSLIGHKEDCFMFPVLPLFFVLLGTALETAARQGPWRARAVRLFWMGNAVALAIATLSDAQQNLTRPFLHIARQGGQPAIATVDLNLVPDYYLDGHGQVTAFADLPALERAVHDDGAHFDYVLLRDPQEAPAAQALQPLGCGPPHLFFGDWLDRALVWANRHNVRRDATALLTCGDRLANAARVTPR